MPTLADVRSMFPAWLPWAPLLLHVPAVMLASGFISWLCARIALWPARRLHQGHWTERARHAYPARLLLPLLLLANPAMNGFWGASASGPLFYWPGRVTAALLVLAAWLGTAFAYWRVETLINGRRDTFPRRLHCLTAIYLMLRPVIVLAALLCLTLPERFDLRAGLLLLAAIAALALHLGGGAFWLGQRLGLCAPARPRLAAAVERAAQAIGQTAPPVYEIPTSGAYAAAYVTARRLVFSDVAARELSEDELAAIASHELAHLNEKRSLIWARTVTAFTLLPVVCAFPLINSFGVAGYCAVVVVCVVPGLLLRRVTRRMEVHADHEAACHVADPQDFARALEHVYEFNLAPAQMFGKGGTHPHLYDRLLAAGFTPDYPRPAAPSRVPGMLALAAFTLFWMIPGLVLSAPSVPWASDEQNLIARLALTGGGLHTFRDFAYRDFDKGNLDGAVRLYRAAVALDSSPYSAIDLALTLAGAGRCEEAAAALAHAHTRASAHPSTEQVERFGDAQGAVADCEPPPRSVENARRDW
jgi:Zn-dependent protease with chaperone function